MAAPFSQVISLQNTPGLDYLKPGL